MAFSSSIESVFGAILLNTMGHLQRADLINAYKRIRKDAAGRTASILILVAPTVDALCALKILTVSRAI